MISPHRYLLFDLDGTLVDSVADLTTSLNLLGRELGQQPISPEYVCTIVGDGAGKLIKRAFGEENYRREQLLRFLEIYAEHLFDQTRCYPGIKELLQRYPVECLAVVTNKPHQLTMQLLEGLQLHNYFQVVVGGDSYPEKKPHPLPVEKTLATLGAEPDQAIMIGDHHTDLYSGQAAGIATCFCAYGLGNTDGLEPDFRVQSSIELLNIFPGFLS